MRAIASGFFESSPAMLGPVVALVLFVALFLAAVVVALRARTPWLEEAASLPLRSEGERVPTRASGEPSPEERT